MSLLLPPLALLLLLAALVAPATAATAYRPDWNRLSGLTRARVEVSTPASSPDTTVPQPYRPPTLRPHGSTVCPGPRTTSNLESLLSPLRRDRPSCSLAPDDPSIHRGRLRHRLWGLEFRTLPQLPLPGPPADTQTH